MGCIKNNSCNGDHANEKSCFHYMISYNLLIAFCCVGGMSIREKTSTWISNIIVNSANTQECPHSCKDSEIGPGEPCIYSNLGPESLFMLCKVQIKQSFSVSATVHL